MMIQSFDIIESNLNHVSNQYFKAYVSFVALLFIFRASTYLSQ